MRINQKALKSVKENNPNNQLARCIPTWKDSYEPGGPLWEKIGEHFNWEGRASKELRELLSAGVLPDDGESEQGKNRRLY